MRKPAGSPANYFYPIERAALSDIIEMAHVLLCEEQMSLRSLRPK